MEKFVSAGGGGDENGFWSAASTDRWKGNRIMESETVVSERVNVIEANKNSHNTLSNPDTRPPLELLETSCSGLLEGWARA